MSTRKNLYIDQGATYSESLPVLDENGDPRDLTGYSAAATMRESYYSANGVSFAASAANGAVTLSLTADQTSNVEARRYVYDATITSGNTVTRVYEGLATVRPGATKRVAT